MAAGLEPEKARALPMFHALTGCNTMSSFAGHGKKTAWAIWIVLPELTDALLEVSSALSTTPEDVLHCTERFVILLYNRTRTSTDIDKARRKLFSKKNNVQLLPPPRTCEEGDQPGMSGGGTNTATKARTSFINQLGLDQD